jgi:hypothetical protein
MLEVNWGAKEEKGQSQSVLIRKGIFCLYFPLNARY